MNLATKYLAQKSVLKLKIILTFSETLTVLWRMKTTFECLKHF